MFKSLISNSRRRQFLNLLIFYASFLWYRIFGFSVLAPLFLARNITQQQMIMGNVYFFLATVLWLIIFKKQSSRYLWLTANFSTIIALLFASQLVNVWQYYLYCFLLGVGAAAFFVPYNIAHSRLTPGHCNSFSAAIMFSIIPVISFAAPLLAGFLAQITYNYIWFGSIIFFLLVLYLAKFQHRFSFQISIKKDLAYLKPTWLIVVLQGLWEPVNFAVIPIFALTFITNPLAFGSFLSYLGLVAIAANLFLGRLSDRLNNRLNFLIPTTILLALTTIIMPFTLNSLTGWLILGGINNFLAPLFWNFSTAYFVDLQPDSNQSMPIREWLLAVSRTFSLILIFLSFNWFKQSFFIFYFLSIVMLIYPLVLIYNTKHAVKS